MRDEIKRTEDLIAEFLTDHKLFRPPYGAHNSTVDRVVRDLNYHMVLWSVDSDDWRAERKPKVWVDLSVEAIRKRGHSVFLCHDIHPTTVNNLPEFLQKVAALPKARFVAYAQAISLRLLVDRGRKHPRGCGLCVALLQRAEECFDAPRSRAVRR